LTVLVVVKRVDCNDGVAAYLESLISGLGERGHTVILLSGSVTTLYGSEARRARLEAACAEWTVVEAPPGPRSTLAMFQRLLSIVRSRRVDVINPQGFSALPASRLAGLITGRPVVMNFHLLPERLDPGRRAVYRLLPALCPADAYIAMSSDIARFFREVCAIPQHRIHGRALGIDTDHFRPPDAVERRAARGAFDLDDTCFMALLPGRMNRSKGHDVATRAFRLLRSRAPLDAICLFAGDGDEREAIEADSLRDDADRATFRFLGLIDRETMRHAYWAADIVLLPSRLEGFGLVVIEAMACGAIVIRTPGSGWRDQITTGETGFIVPFDDPSALADMIETVANHSGRDRLRVNAARVAAERFSRTAMIDGTEAILRDVAVPRRQRATA
jgi:glycosyltransferase involved in cell wall biosynthesis